MTRAVPLLLLAVCLSAAAFSATGASATGTSLSRRAASRLRAFSAPLEPQGLFRGRRAASGQASGLAGLQASAGSPSALAASQPGQNGQTQPKAASFWNDNTKLGLYLAVWYLGNVYYNIYNKKACLALGNNASGGANLHWLLAFAQLTVGALFVVPMWLTGLRRAPELTSQNWRELGPVGLWASLSHAFSVLALGAGAVSFGQIVKSAEPVFAAATNALLLKDIDHPMVYAALLPIIGGVSLASLKELSFTWTALIAASLANQAAAFKNVVSKGVMAKPWAKALGPQNTYAVVNLLAMLFTVPMVLAFDAKDAMGVYNQVMKNGLGMDVLKYSLYSGLAFYLYNEASFLALEKLSPVTHSVANTLKRVVIIVASAFVFNTKISLLGGVGSGVAILGTLLYSLAKQTYSKKAHGHGH